MKILSKEIALINELSKIINRKRKTRSGLIVGIGDDAAILKVPPHENLIVTTDCLIENVHFTLKTTSPRQLGWKSLAVNLSDIASMGGVPLYGFISIAIPSHIDEAWIKEFYRGIKKCSDKFNVVIAGGDTSRSPHELMINVVIIGQSEGKKAALRSSAKAGDLLFVTGTFGASGTGLALLQRYPASLPAGFRPLIKAHLEPQPRVEEGLFLLGKSKRLSLMDSSDGLANALQLISLASGVGLEVEEPLIPISHATQKACRLLKADPLEKALNGGEDYELVGTCSSPDFEKIIKDWKSITPLKVIGKVHQGRGVTLTDAKGKKKPLISFGYDHFKKG